MQIFTFYLKCTKIQLTNIENLYSPRLPTCFYGRGHIAHCYCM